MSKPITEAVAIVGGPSALAALIGVTPGAISQFASDKRPLPPDRCPDIERATGGRVTCEQLRPDIRWARIPDSAWPHPAGRPCIDVAQAAPAPEALEDRAA